MPVLRHAPHFRRDQAAESEPPKRRWDWTGRTELKKRGEKFRSLTEAIDTATPTGRAMWQMIGVLAELERSLVVERTRAGVKAAQQRGVKFGRKPKLSAPQIAHARKLIDQGEAVLEVARLLRVDRATIYRALNREAM